MNRAARKGPGSRRGPRRVALVAPLLRRNAGPADGSDPWFEPMPPLWALALASHLRACLPGAEPEILDEQLLGRAGLERKLAAGRYDLAGFSPVAYTYPDVLRLARLARRSGAFVVLGGHYAPPLAREILALRGPGSADHCVDGIVSYDGEAALEALARGAPPSSVPGLAWPGPGGLRRNEPADADLAALAPVDYSLADIPAYFRLQSKACGGVLPYVSQRGCRWAQGPGRCFFCSIQTRGGLRALPPERAAREMLALAARHGARQVFEGSDDFPADPDWLAGFSAAAAGLRGFPALRVFARATTVTERAARQLKAANVRVVSLGVEAMSDAVLRAARKGATAAANARAVKRLLAAGLLPKLHLILGLPGETRATLSEAFANFRKLPLPAGSPERVLLASTFAVFPGTGAWARLLAKEPRHAGRDLYDEEALFSDWLRHFTSLTPADVEGARDALERLFAARVRTVPPRF